MVWRLDFNKIIKKMNSRTIKSVGWASSYRDGRTFSLNVFNKPNSATICPSVQQELLRLERRRDRNEQPLMWKSIGSDTWHTPKTHTLKPWPLGVCQGGRKAIVTPVYMQPGYLIFFIVSLQPRENGTSFFPSQTHRCAHMHTLVKGQENKSEFLKEEHGNYP